MRRVSWLWFSVLWGAWILLQGKPSLGGGLLGGAVALLVAIWLAPAANDVAHVRLGPLLRLAGRVAWDIPASNLAVAWVLLSRARRVQPAWVSVPLDLPNDARVVVLAGIVTLTPGTLSVDYDAARSRLLVHALDTGDPDAVARGIKSRYESLLMEIYA